VAVGTGGSVGGKTITFDFRITQYTTDEEVQNFAQLVKDKGTDALRRALEKEDKGRITPVGSTGNQIAVARKRALPTTSATSTSRSPTSARNNVYCLGLSVRTSVSRAGCCCERHGKRDSPFPVGW
jgi:hypothetical protein